MNVIKGNKWIDVLKGGNKMACKTPGRKIRSKGKGRGLGIGQGTGPIGRRRR